MPGDSTLTLFIPDLFGFQSTLSQLSKDENSQLPGIKCPVLEKWLSRGSHEKSNSDDDAVFSEFGLSVEKDSDKHSAALSLLAESISDKEVNKNAYWLCADPVNIQPDRDTALLVAYEELALTQDEANKLVDQINKHFIDEPWQLYSFAPHRWYLCLEKIVDLKTSPLKRVLGEDINQFMPQGDDDNYWFKITNEIQMLLHGSSVNFERESRNKITANSIWIWGGGSLPESKSTPHHNKIITDNILFSGVGQYCGCDVLRLDQKLPDNIGIDNTFVVLDMLSEHVQRRDLYTFIQTLNEIETVFIIYCNELLENGEIDNIKLLTDDGITIIITKKQLRHWWKRIKPFAGFKDA